VKRSLLWLAGEICLALAVVPGLCTGAFWNELFQIYFGGGVVTVMKPGSTWDWSRCRATTASPAVPFRPKPSRSIRTIAAPS
jgi:hypothetical protein